MLNWWLKQVKDFIFKSSIRGSFFSVKQFLNLYTMTLASFHSDGRADEAINNQIQLCLFPSLSHIDSY